MKERGGVCSLCVFVAVALLLRPFGGDRSPLELLEVTGPFHGSISPALSCEISFSIVRGERMVEVGEILPRIYLERYGLSSICYIVFS